MYKRTDVHTMKGKKAAGHKFHLDARYEVYDMIGYGAYGVVVAAIDKYYSYFNKQKKNKIIFFFLLKFKIG